VQDENHPQAEGQKEEYGSLEWIVINYQLVSKPFGSLSMRLPAANDKHLIDGPQNCLAARRATHPLG
jgi:hypothetical protein